MLSFIRNLKILKFASLFSQNTMPKDAFQQLFDNRAALTMDTASFSEHYRQLMLLLPIAPDIVASRFMVQSITLSKHMSTSSQHEYLSIDIVDTDNSNSHLIFLKRTTSGLRFDSGLDETYFLDNPESASIYNFIISRALPPSPHSSSDHLIPSTLTPSDSSSSFTRFANVSSLASTGAI